MNLPAERWAKLPIFFATTDHVDRRAGKPSPFPSRRGSSTGIELAVIVSRRLQNADEKTAASGIAG